MIESKMVVFSVLNGLAPLGSRSPTLALLPWLTRHRRSIYFHTGHDCYIPNE